jgi:hypothetical protein
MKIISGLIILALVLICVYYFLIKPKQDKKNSGTTTRETGNIKIYPESVGVFTTVGVQQFVALDSGKNITREVSWESSDNNLVSINGSGLATIMHGITSGQVTISCQGVAKTTLTIVNVTEFIRSGDVTRWGGSWPSSPDTLAPSAQELYISSAVYGANHLGWITTPSVIPYPPFPNKLNSLLAAVWSLDGGKTFKLQSWDYLAPSSNAKDLAEGMPTNKIGTMIHSICDRKDGECNGRNRSNLIFSDYPKR